MTPADAAMLLGLNASATHAEIRAAFKRQSLIYHPDKNLGNPEATALFQRVVEARDTLLGAGTAVDDLLPLPEPVRYVGERETVDGWYDWSYYPGTWDEDHQEYRLRRFSIDDFESWSYWFSHVGQDAWRRAASKGWVRVLRMLVVDYDVPVDGRVDYGPEDCVTALQLAATGGHQRAVLLLLDLGADVNSRDWHDSTALHWALNGLRLNGLRDEPWFRAHGSRLAACVRVLIARGADVDEDWSDYRNIYDAHEVVDALDFLELVKAAGGWPAYVTKRNRVLTGVVSKCARNLPDDAARLVVDHWAV